MIDAFKFRQNLWIVLELMDAGSLAEVFGQNIIWKESHIAFVCRSVLSGLAYMHHYHRIHRDIKSDNILVSMEGHVKLADFGYTITLTEDEQKRQSVVGKWSFLDVRMY